MKVLRAKLYKCEESQLWLKRREKSILSEGFFSSYFLSWLVRHAISFEFPLPILIQRLSKFSSRSAKEVSYLSPFRLSQPPTPSNSEIQCRAPRSSESFFRLRLRKWEFQWGCDWRLVLSWLDYLPSTSVLLSEVLNNWKGPERRSLSWQYSILHRIRRFLSDLVGKKEKCFPLFSSFRWNPPPVLRRKPGPVLSNLPLSRKESM